MIWLGKAKDPREVKVIMGNGLLGQISSMPYYYGNLSASSITDSLVQALQYGTTSVYHTTFGTFTLHNGIGNETA